MNEDNRESIPASEPQPEIAASEAQRNLGAMLLNDAHGVIVDGVKVAVGIGIAKALDRRKPPDAKPPKGGEGE